MIHYDREWREEFIGGLNNMLSTTKESAYQELTERLNRIIDIRDKEMKKENIKIKKKIAKLKAGLVSSDEYFTERISELGIALKLCRELKIKEKS
jgi:hypothetical protein